MGFNDLLTTEVVVKRRQGWEKNRYNGVNGQQRPTDGPYGAELRREVFRPVHNSRAEGLFEMEVSANEEGAGNVGIGVTNGTQLDDGRWNGQALSAPLNMFLSSGDQGAREAHWASHTQSLYPIPATFQVQAEQ